MVSEFTVTKCDRCGKIVTDIYEEVHWITLSPNTYNSSFSYTVRGGRKDNANPITLVFREFTRLDFCRFGCMMAYFANLIKEGKEKIREEHNGSTVQQQKKKGKKV